MGVFAGLFQGDPPALGPGRGECLPAQLAPDSFDGLLVRGPLPRRAWGVNYLARSVGRGVEPCRSRRDAGLGSRGARGKRTPGAECTLVARDR